MGRLTLGHGDARHATGLVPATPGRGRDLRCLPALGRQRVNVGLALAATLPGTYLGFFGYAAVVILASAERFADGLVQTGQQFGISPFFLVQLALAALEPGGAELIALSVAYLILAAVLMVRARHRLGPLVRDGLRTPYQRLTARPNQTPPPGGRA